jgi:TolB protein
MDIGDALQDTDGSNLVRLTDDPADDYTPAWSPDGRQIAFYSERDGNYEIYVMNSDGSGLVRLTDHPANDRWPAWSPDGKKIAFTSERDGNYEIYVMSVEDALQGAEGSNLVRLTDNPADDGDPAWSPDGKKIAFTSDRDGNYNYEIYVTNVEDALQGAEGSDPVRLTHEDGFPPHEGARGPAWSPDGGQIAFTSDRDGDDDIYVMDIGDALQAADGGDLVRLTDNPAFDEAPTWSPDGQKIAFQSYWGGNFEIYVMNADGSGLVRLTNNPADDRVPAWAPQ